MFFISCENDIKQVQKLSAKVDSAIVSAKNVEMRYTIKGKLQVHMTAPELNRYIEQGGKAYTDFPKGMKLTFFNDEGVESSTLRANYSVYWESDGIWEAEYNVVAINDKGEQLNTEYLVWNQKSEQISTDRAVKMFTSDGVIYGDGFISNQNFTSWEVINGHGEIELDDYE